MVADILADNASPHWRARRILADTISHSLAGSQRPGCRGAACTRRPPGPFHFTVTLQGPLMCPRQDVHGTWCLQPCRCHPARTAQQACCKLRVRISVTFCVWRTLACTCCMPSSYIYLLSSSALADADGSTASHHAAAERASHARHADVDIESVTFSLEAHVHLGGQALQSRNGMETRSRI
jgi:hypothetical protein